MKKKDSKKKREKKKNFCDACGLNVTIPADSENDSRRNEAFFKKLEDLDLKKKGRFGIDRTITIGGTTHSLIDFCAVGSKSRIKRGNRRVLWIKKRCKDFQIKLPDLKLPDFISIYTTKRNSRIANRLTIIAIVIAVLGLLLILFSAEVKCFLKNLF